MASSRIIKARDVSFLPVDWTETTVKPLSNHAPRTTDLDAAGAEAAAAHAFERGYREGQTAANAIWQGSLAEIKASLATSIAELSSVRGAICRAAQRDVLRLSLAIARRVIHREVLLAPEILQSICATVLEKLERQEVYRVRVHPKMSDGVEAELRRLSPARPITVLADSSLSEGDCVFETNCGIVDAGIESQLAEIESGLADRLEAKYGRG